MFFYENPDANSDASNRYVFVPLGIVRKDELFDLFSKELNFPDYFGRNWDALYDCMSDLAWIPEHKIIITHKDIPFAKEWSEQKIYLDMLIDLVNNWSKDSKHIILVKFPCFLQAEIEALLQI